MALTNLEFYLIVPTEATNEIAYNPSFELIALTSGGYGVTAHGAGVTISQVSTQQLHGVRSLEVTPASGVESGAYYETVNEVSGAARTFSVGVKGVAGQQMRVQIRTTAGALLTETVFTANGYWQRKSVTRVGSADTTRRLYVVRDAEASTAPFYLDGLYYSTVNGTYLDGDMKGFVKKKGAPEYRWLGTPHASQSWRSGKTRSGGTMIRIKDYARILLVLGLGMVPVLNIGQPLTIDQSSYQTTRANDREIIFQMAFSGDPGEIQANRQAIIAAINPWATAVKQPVVIHYQGMDENGEDASEPVDIIAHYVDGLGNLPGQPGLEKADVRFTSYLPFIQRSKESGVVLGYQTSIANFHDIGYRDTDGTWHAMGTGLNAGSVMAMAIHPITGDLYVGGQFADAGGVADTVNIARWDGTTWHPLATGTNGQVRALVFGPDGTLYAGGLFTNLGGADGDYIAKWDGSNWSALGTGAASDVYALEIGPDGTLYAGGDFASMGGVANTAKIAKWNGTTWAPMGTGMNNDVYVIRAGPDSSIYAGGLFTAASGVANTLGIARWDGSSWSALGAGISTTFVYDIAFGPDGTLYAGGSFLWVTIVDDGMRYLAKWNGSQWSPVGIGSLNADVRCILPGPDGSLYIGGAFTKVGEVALPDRGLQIVGATFLPIDVDVQDGSGYFTRFAMDGSGKLYLGGQWTGGDALSATVNAQNLGGVVAYPVIKFTGPGNVWQVKNYTTGKAIWFKNLALQQGEVATLDLRPGKTAFTSTFRSDLMSYLLNGSNLDFYLQQGENHISSFMTGTSAESDIEMYVQEGYLSLDGAAR